MKTINRDDFVKALLILFKESFEGLSTKEGNVFLDGGVGVFTTLGNIDARQASQNVNFNTIAGHSEHARFYLELLNNYLAKDFRIIDFDLSWRVKTVGDDEWEKLRENLAEIYRKIGETFRHNDEWTFDTITVAMGMMTHTAYHLGAIRQMLKNL